MSGTYVSAIDRNRNWAETLHASLNAKLGRAQYCVECAEHAGIADPYNERVAARLWKRLRGLEAWMQREGLAI